MGAKLSSIKQRPDIAAGDRVTGLGVTGQHS